LPKILGRQAKFNALSFQSYPISPTVLQGSCREFYQFLSTSKASQAEVRSQLYGVLDNKLRFQNHGETKHFAFTDEVSRIIDGLRETVDKKRKKV